METLASFLDWPWMVALMESSTWVWPIAEMFHYLGMALLIGTVGLLDVRILGFGREIPIAALDRFVAIGFIGFALNLITGLMFVTGNPLGQPIDYLTNLAFQIKMLLILLAGLNLLVFHVTGLARATEAVPASGEAPAAAKAVAIASLVFWFGVIYFGRMIMYNETLLYSLGR